MVPLALDLHGPDSARRCGNVLVRCLNATMLSDSIGEPVIGQTPEQDVTHIRPATIEDTAQILHFIRELAIYEKAEHEVLATEQDIRDTVFGVDSRVDALICEHAGEAIGFAVYFFNYSTWLGKYGLFLEDLYVTPEHRGIGAGKALLSRLARVAIERGCGRFEWNVLDWNTPSIDFYESLGAEAQNEWTGYRLTGEALTKLAEQS